MNYQREKYPFTGPNYAQYGEVPGYVYHPWTDKYYIDTKAQNEYYYNTGQKDRPKDPPSAGEQIGLYAAGTGAAALAQQGGKYIAGQIAGGSAGAGAGTAATTATTGTGGAVAGGTGAGSSGLLGAGGGAGAGTAGAGAGAGAATSGAPAAPNVLYAGQTTAGASGSAGAGAQGASGGINLGGMGASGAAGIAAGVYAAYLGYKNYKAITDSGVEPGKFTEKEVQSVVYPDYVGEQKFLHDKLGLPDAPHMKYGAVAMLAKAILGSGKEENQIYRDRIRDFLEENTGIVTKGEDGAHYLELADGTQFNIGRDGKSSFKGLDGSDVKYGYESDWSNPLTGYAAGTLNPVIKLLTAGEDDHGFQAQLVNAATSNARDLKDVLANIRHIVGGLGYGSREQFYEGLGKLKEDGKITDQELAFYQNAANEIFDPNFTPPDSYLGPKPGEDPKPPEQDPQANPEAEAQALEEAQTPDLDMQAQERPVSEKPNFVNVNPGPPANTKGAGLLADPNRPLSEEDKKTLFKGPYSGVQISRGLLG